MCSTYIYNKVLLTYNRNKSFLFCFKSKGIKFYAPNKLILIYLNHCTKDYIIILLIFM